MHEERLEFLNGQKETIIAVLHSPSSPCGKAVIVCHGLGGDKDKCWIKDMCNSLASDGIAGVRIDFSGNGESGGRFEDMTYGKLASELKSLIDLLTKKGYNSLGLVGHSMGGAIVIIAGVADNRVKAVVNISGVAYPALEEHVVFVRKHFETAFEKPKPSDRFIAELQNVDVLEAAKNLHAPLLTIHGDADQVVPLNEGEAINEAANEPKKMVILFGCGHRLSQDQEMACECIELSKEWMQKHL
ncbi:MAG: alpha/beta hydrolase [Nanoarchaeota archaeon]